MGGIQNGTKGRNPQNDTIHLEMIINQMGLGTHKRFPMKNESVTLEQSVAKSDKDAES